MLWTLASAELQNVWVTQDFLKNNIKIIDIRTPGEWVETGIVKDSYPIMFFNEQGQYDIPKFLAQLNAVVKKGEKFAIICRTGSRTSMVGDFLGREMGYDVINLAGGIQKLMQEGYKPVAYRP